MRGRQREREKFSVCTQSDENHVYGAHLLLLLRPQLKHTHTHTHTHTRTHVRGCRRTHAHPRIDFNTWTKKSWEPPPIHWFDLSIKQAQTHTRTHTHAQKHQKKNIHTQKKTQPPSLLACGVNYSLNTLSSPRASVCVCVCLRVCECVCVGRSRGGMSGNNKGQFHPNYHPDYHYIKEPFMAFINATTKQRWCLSPLLWACIHGCGCIWERQELPTKHALL